MSQTGSSVTARAFLFPAALLLSALALSGITNAQDVSWTKDETPIRDQITHLRSLPDDVRARTTKQLALDIRRLPKTANKLNLANGLANLSTEGDFGHDTLQEVATTLADALREQPVPIQSSRGRRTRPSS